MNFEGEVRQLCSSGNKMLEKIALYFSIFITSAVKFIAGPTIGVASNLTVFETTLFTALGMMLTITLFTLFGRQMRSLLSKFSNKKKRIFSKRSRRFVIIWRKYGIQGTAFLTPLILTPIGGAILANAFRSRHSKIFSFMTISAVFWGFALTLLLKYAKELIF